MTNIITSKDQKKGFTAKNDKISTKPTVRSNEATESKSIAIHRERQLQKIRAITENPKPEIIDALSYIDEPVISGDIRQPLEEKDLASINNFINSFSALKTTIDTMFNAIDSLDQSCDQMLNKLSIGDKGVDDVLDMTTSLHNQQEKQVQQLKKINNFMDEFYLSQSDQNFLNNGDINDSFFDAFSRLETVQERTTNTLQTNQSTCLLEVSSSLNKIKENAYQRISRWLQMNSHLFDTLNPCVGNTYEKCLSLIKIKHFLYDFVISDIAKVRGEVVGRSFLRALSSGDKETKPIEASATIDPLQFVGDMFAWIHQCTAVESSFLSGLLKEDLGSKNVKKALSTTFDSVTHPLELRVIQSIKNLVKPADFYQVANICAFFLQQFGEICGMTSSLYKCSETLKQAATDGFKRSINSSIDDIKSEGRPTQGSINEAIHTVSEITSLHKQSSLSSSFDIATLIDGYANGLKTAIEECKDSITFQANALYELLLVCKDANLMSKSHIAEQVDNLLAKIVVDDSNDILIRCRVLETIVMISSIKTDQPLSTIRGLEPDTMKYAIRRYETSLLEGKKRIVTPRCDAIVNVDLRTRGHKEVIDQLANAYRKMYNMVMNPNNGYDSPGKMFKYTPELFAEMIM